MGLFQNTKKKTNKQTIQYFCSFILFRIVNRMFVTMVICCFCAILVIFSSSCSFQTNILFITLARTLKYHTINRSASCKHKIKKLSREAFREVELKCCKAKIEFWLSPPLPNVHLYGYFIIFYYLNILFFINVWSSCFSIFTLVICC